MSWWLQPFSYLINVSLPSFYELHTLNISCFPLTEITSLVLIKTAYSQLDFDDAMMRILNNISTANIISPLAPSEEPVGLGWVFGATLRWIYFSPVWIFKIMIFYFFKKIKLTLPTNTTFIFSDSMLTVKQVERRIIWLISGSEECR